MRGKFLAPLPIVKLAKSNMKGHYTSENCASTVGCVVQLVACRLMLDRIMNGQISYQCCFCHCKPVPRGYMCNKPNTHAPLCSLLHNKIMGDLTAIPLFPSTEYVSWKKRKLFEIHQALNSDPVDIETLRNAAVTEGGLLTDDIRRKVWPKLLNVNVYNLPAKPGKLCVRYSLICSDCLVASILYFNHCKIYDSWRSYPFD